MTKKEATGVLNINYRDKTPIYSMGSPDPVMFLPSATEMKFFVKGVKENAWSLDHSIQGISIQTKGNDITGSIIRSMYIQSTLREKLKKGKVDIQLISNDLMINNMYSIIYGVEIIASGWGASVDDTSLEENITYKAKKYDDWRGFEVPKIYELPSMDKFIEFKNKQPKK